MTLDELIRFGQELRSREEFAKIYGSLRSRDLSMRPLLRHFDKLRQPPQASAALFKAADDLGKSYVALSKRADDTLSELNRITARVNSITKVHFPQLLQQPSETKQ